MGIYEIKATNIIGTSTKTCLLKIMEPSKILENLANITGIEGEDAVLQFKTKKQDNCKIVNTEWFFNGAKIENSEIYEENTLEDEMFSLHTLKIMRIKSLLNEGTYSAKIKNENELFTETNKVKLEIFYQPKFIKMPEDQKIKSETTPLTLTYKIESKPKAELTW